MPAAAKKPTRKALAQDYLERHPGLEITAETLAELRRHVSQALGGAVVSDRYLLDLAEEAGVPIARALGGLPTDLRGRVHFHDFAAAQTSLLDLQAEYQKARAAGDPLRADDCRRAVLRAKDRLALHLRRPYLDPAIRAEKEEILRWFRVWLETPELFSIWLDLRQRALKLT